MKKKNEISYLFGHNIICNSLYKAIRNNIVAKMTIELILLFHKKTTKLVFLWPNVGQKNIKVLKSLFTTQVHMVSHLTTTLRLPYIYILFYISVNEVQVKAAWKLEDGRWKLHLQHFISPD